MRPLELAIHWLQSGSSPALLPAALWLHTFLLMLPALPASTHACLAHTVGVA